jgi:hypothetical protein
MAIIPLSYCNASLGKQISFDFNNESKAITNSVVGATCGAAQPTVIYYDYGPFGLAFQGFVYPSNVAPYAYYVPIGGAVDCLLDITSVPVTNASDNLTANGQLQINISGANLFTDYSIDNGATWQASNIFTGLLPGTYAVVSSGG